MSYVFDTFCGVPGAAANCAALGLQAPPKARTWRSPGVPCETRRVRHGMRTNKWWFSRGFTSNHGDLVILIQFSHVKCWGKNREPDISHPAWNLYQQTMGDFIRQTDGRSPATTIPRMWFGFGVTICSLNVETYNNSPDDTRCWWHVHAQLIIKHGAILCV